MTTIHDIIEARTVTPRGCWDTIYTFGAKYPVAYVEGKTHKIRTLVYNHYFAPGPNQRVANTCGNSRCFNPAHAELRVKRSARSTTYVLLGPLNIPNGYDLALSKPQHISDRQAVGDCALEHLTWSQDQIAEHLGLSQTKVSYILRDLGFRRRPSIDQQIREYKARFPHAKSDEISIALKRSRKAVRNAMMRLLEALSDDDIRDFATSNPALSHDELAAALNVAPSLIREALST